MILVDARQLVLKRYNIKLREADFQYNKYEKMYGMRSIGRANFKSESLKRTIAEVAGDDRERTVLLERAIPSGALLATLDERGRVMSSPEFAEQLARWRDAGRQDVAFVIGGADGVLVGDIVTQIEHLRVSAPIIPKPCHGFTLICV